MTQSATLSAREVNKLKHAPHVEGVLPALLQRWSARSYADRDVPMDDLARVFEAARWAASSNNEQPWRFIVGVRNSETHEKIASVLAGFNKTWAPSAPVLILGVANTLFERNGTPNAYALYDLGAATSYLTLEAAELGLVTHQMAGFDHAAMRQQFGIPESYALGCVVALGYQGEPAALGNETLIAREHLPRDRKPLSELVFSSWGQPAHLDSLDL
jgi:nitroreductase